MKILHKIEDGKVAHEISKKTEKVDISKPYPNEHACRLEDPKKYDTCRRGERTAHKPESVNGKKYQVIYCKKGNGPMEQQAFRYPKDKWTAGQAKAHCKFNEGKFEPASDKIGKEEGVEEVQALNFGFKKIDKKEHIVGGIVYEPDKEDSQGDQANAKEIWKALKNYMIKGKSIKVLHKGKAKNVPIVECFQAEEDTHKGGTGPEHLIKKGAWWLSVYLGGEPEIWKDVLAGKLNGFSMAGRAEAST